MNEIKYQKLDTLLKYLKKSKIKAGEGKEEGKYPFYTSSAKLTKKIDIATYIDESIVLGSGGLASIHYANQPFSTSTDCFVLTSIDENIDLKYVYYYLKSNIRLLEDGFKGVGLKHISKKYLSNIKIPIIKPIEKQRKISAFLTRLEELIEKRQESIKLLDELIKSTFLDMFGDPVLNTKRWKTNTIEKLVKNEPYAIKRGPFGGALKKEIFVDEGYLVYEQYHALNNEFSMARYFIDDEKFNELKGFEVKAGDIIISCSGVYLGKLAIVPPKAKKGIINQALLKISLDESKMKNMVFTHIFTNKNFRNKFFAANRGAGIPNFPPMKNFKKFLFITPPIKLQDKFTDIVIKIEDRKKLYQNSLDELTNLFNSIAQKAFKGELDVSKIEAKENFLNKINLKLEEHKDNITLEHTKTSTSTPIFDKNFLKILIQQATILNNDKLMEVIYNFDFEKQPTFEDIKNTLIELLDKNEIEQIYETIETTKGFEYKIAFKVKN